MTPPATKTLQTRGKPVLLVDVDGVVSLFGFDSDRHPAGSWLNVDGIVHLISATAGQHLHRLSTTFDLTWCTGWEDKANEHLVRALGLPGALPTLAFDGPATSTAHWKLAAVDAHLGVRPAAWIDDAFNDACHAWAEARGAPTLLVATQPPTGITAEHVAELERWAAALGPGARRSPSHGR
jgi:hypothetical protein